jgi:hypothetical protein
MKAHRQVLERDIAVDRERGTIEIEMQQHGGSMNRMLLQTKLSLEQGCADLTVFLDVMNRFQKVTGWDDARTTKEVELDGITKERVELEIKIRLLSRKIGEGATANAGAGAGTSVKGGFPCVLRDKA